MSYHYPHHVGKIAPTGRPDSERVSRLVGCYPGITAEEASEILDFLRRGRRGDVGRLTANDNLRPNLDAFIADHQADFGTSWGKGAALIGGAAALLAILWLAWETAA